MPKLIIVGSVGIDTIETPHTQRDNLLGGSAAYACAAASFHTEVGMVGVVGTDFPDAHRNTFDHFRIDTSGLRTEEGRTFAWSGVYHENMDDRDTRETVLGVFEHFSPNLPEAYRTTDHVFLGNIHPELQLHVLEQVDDPAFVLVDTMDLWINVAHDALTKVIGRVHMLTVNESEARLYTGRHNLVDAAEALLQLGPKYVLIKRGASGSMLFGQSGSRFILPAYPVRVVRDPTGAGDTFAGGLMGSLADQGKLDEEHLRRAMVHGTVVASAGVEAFSLDRLVETNREELDERARELSRWLELPDLAGSR